MTSSEGKQDGKELIAFRVGRQEFCIDVMVVREIRGWTEVTALPRVPAYVKGVMNLRGAVLPIIDLGMRLGMPGAEPTARHVIIVVQLEQRQVGVLVDAVSDILTVSDTLIQPVPDVTSTLVKSFVKGLLAVEGRMVSLIEVESLLPAAELEPA